MSDLTPYAGTSGHSGGTSSEDRARRQDTDGTTRRLRDALLRSLALRHIYGLTCREGEHTTGRGHGAVSGALSRMHKAGQVARLTYRRNGQEVYVLPEWVDGRDTVPYRPNTAVPDPRWTVTARGMDTRTGGITGRLQGRRWVDVDGVRYYAAGWEQS